MQFGLITRLLTHLVKFDWFPSNSISFAKLANRFDLFCYAANKFDEFHYVTDKFDQIQWVAKKIDQFFGSLLTIFGLIC